MSDDNGGQLQISKNVARWLLLIGIAVAVIFSMGAAYYTLTTTTDQVDKNAESIAQFKRAFRVDKVCSLSNQGQACRDLFDRLAMNISRKQRLELACVVLESLNTVEARRMLRDANCETVLADTPMPP